MGVPASPCGGTIGSPAVTLNCTPYPPTEGRKKVAPNLGAESEDQGTSTAFTACRAPATPKNTCERGREGGEKSRWMGKHRTNCVISDTLSPARPPNSGVYYFLTLECHQNTPSWLESCICLSPAACSHPCSNVVSLPPLPLPPPSPSSSSSFSLCLPFPFMCTCVHLPVS